MFEITKKMRLLSKATAQTYGKYVQLCNNYLKPFTTLRPKKVEGETNKPRPLRTEPIV